MVEGVECEVKLSAAAPLLGWGPRGWGRAGKGLDQYCSPAVRDGGKVLFFHG